MPRTFCLRRDFSLLLRRRRGRVALRAGPSVFLEFLELLHLFFVELVELFELFLREDFGECVDSVDAVFEQSLVGFQHLRLRGFDGGLISAFERLSKGLFGSVLVPAQFLEDGVSLGAICVKSGLLFRCHFQHGVDDDGIHLVLEFRSLEVAVWAVFLEFSRMVWAAGGRHHAMARARAFHFFAAGHFALAAAHAAFAAEVSQEEPQGQGKHGKACGEEFCSFHIFTPLLNS